MKKNNMPLIKLEIQKPKEGMTGDDVVLWQPTEDGGAKVYAINFPISLTHKEKMMVFTIAMALKRFQEKTK